MILHKWLTTSSGVSQTVTSLSISVSWMKPPAAMLLRSHSSKPLQKRESYRMMGNGRVRPVWASTKASESSSIVPMPPGMTT